MKTNKKVLLTATLLIASSAFISGPVAAQTSTVLSVSAVVANSCVVTALPLAFVYDPASPSTNTSSTTIDVATCFDPYEVAIDACTNGGGTTTSRQMDLLGTKLDYSLNCSTEGDAECLGNWGDNQGVDTLTGVPGVLEIYTVDGEIAAGQGVPSGAYVDVCTVSLQF